MDTLLKLLHMFNAAAVMLAGYIPQNKEEVLDLLKKGFGLLGGLNIWLGSVLGIDIQKIINICIEFIIKYISLAFNFLIELLKKLSENV